MTFLETRFLYAGLAGVLMVILGLWQLRKRNLLTKSFSERPEAIARAKPHWAEVIEVVFMGAGVVLMSIALAGPVQKDVVHESVRREGMDVVFVVDTSRSMLAQDHGFSRIECAKQALLGVLEKMGGDAVSLVAFAGSAECICPLTHDLESFAGFVEGLDSDSAPGGGSSLFQGIDAAGRILNPSSNRQEKSGRHAQCIVLLSDGEDLGRHDQAVVASRAAWSRGVPLFTVMIGKPEGAYIDLGPGQGRLKDVDGNDLLSRPNPDLLRRMAAEGGGCFVADQETAFPLDYLYSRHLVRLAEDAQYASGVDQAARADYQGMLLAALILMLCALFHPFRMHAGKGVACALIVLLLPVSAYARDDAFDMARQGMEHYGAGRYQEARHCFEQAFQSMPHESGLAVNLGLACYRSGLYEKALTCFEKAFDAEEKNVAHAALFGAGLAAFRSAEDALALSEALDFSEASALLVKGLEHLKRSERRFRQCLEQGVWIDEASSNVAHTEQLLVRMKARLAMLKREQADSTNNRTESTDRGAQPGEGDAAGDDGDPAVTEGGTASRDPDDLSGPEGADQGTPDRTRPVRRSLTKAEKDRILALLRELERKRIALDKAAKKAARQAVQGADW